MLSIDFFEFNKTKQKNQKEENQTNIISNPTCCCIFTGKGYKKNNLFITQNRLKLNNIKLRVLDS